MIITAGKEITLAFFDWRVQAVTFELVRASHYPPFNQFILCYLPSPQLSQTVSDLTTVLYLKEAELQYWQSR